MPVLDVAQLLKHMLGLGRSCQRWTLCCLWFEFAGPIAEHHCKELCTADPSPPFVVESVQRIAERLVQFAEVLGQRIEKPKLLCGLELKVGQDIEGQSQPLLHVSGTTACRTPGEAFISSRELRSGVDGRSWVFTPIHIEAMTSPSSEDVNRYNASSGLFRQAII
jgi:hypothetical protein